MEKSEARWKRHGSRRWEGQDDAKKHLTLSLLGILVWRLASWLFCCNGWASARRCTLVSTVDGAIGCGICSPSLGGHQEHCDAGGPLSFCLCNIPRVSIQFTTTGPHMQLINPRNCENPPHILSMFQTLQNLFLTQMQAPQMTSTRTHLSLSFSGYLPESRWYTGCHRRPPHSGQFLV